ncbi:hypothetical protein AALP_AA5G107600 [Arabis alpina]|uniref:Uncharacterized protein n=1 Tax=Arabis alpina TaxID=50452 RepID=A0A087GWA2_ARAAL|nr:hypothetical protein AALP_AA5G107600 [Arabis alpina]
MFGRLRPPPSPPESLERYPAKIIKDDPLSVYETTLLKLKQGSRLDTSSETEAANLSSSSSSNSVQASHVCSDVTLCNGSDEMAIDSGSGQSEQLKNKNPSVLSMFSNYKKARD